MFCHTPMRAILLLLCAALTSTASAAELNFKQDGWYRWEVPAGRGGQNACCYRFSGDTVKLAGCRLGDGMDEFSPAGECDVTSDSMQIFVEVSNGRVREIRPLSSNCPVKTHFEVRTIEDVTPAESINWLRREIYENGTEADEAIMTLSFHSEAQALGALFEILEDTDLRHDAREQALFWLVQTDSDEAYAYLDKLLN